MSERVLPVGNTLDVAVTDLKKADGTEVTDATITFTLKDEDGTVVLGCDGVSVPNVGGNDYRASVTPTTDLTAGENYRATIEASNYTLKWEQWFEAVTRSFEI